MAHNAVIALIRDTMALLGEEPLILASQEDAHYFRSTAKKGTPPPAKRTHPVDSQIVTKSIPPPAPKKGEPPAPAPKPAAAPPPPPQPDPDLADAHTSFPSFQTLKGLVRKVAPEVGFIEEIPGDAMAKKVANRWKAKNQTAPISILSFGEPALQKKLLEEICLALDVYFGPAHLIGAESIEKEKQWDAFLSVPTLKLVIVCDYSLWQMSHLMHHYKENPATGMRTLNTTPLFLLPDLSLYLKDPLLKRSLWRALCQKLSS